MFHLPLWFWIKQGQQQLQLWIKRANLMFTMYEELHISNDQTNRITDWLFTWDLGETMIAHDATRPPLTAQRIILDSIESETNAPRLHTDQTNISNWLKSWGHNNHLQTQHNTTMTTVHSQESTINRYFDLE
jgi:hypothetical protein